MAANVRRSRNGHPRLETSLTHLVETANNNSRFYPIDMYPIFKILFIRSAAGELNSVYAESVEDRQVFRERRMEMEARQRELDREAKEADREVKEREKEKDRQLARENGILFASAIARILPGASGCAEKKSKKNLNFQFIPEEGSEPFPLLVSLTSLPSLLRFVVCEGIPF